MIKNFFFVLALMLLLLPSSPALASSMSPVTVDTPSPYPGSSASPLYQISASSLSAAQSVPAGFKSSKTPVQGCAYGFTLYGDSAKGIPSYLYLGNHSPAYFKPLFIDNDSNIGFQVRYVTSCSIWYYPLIDSDDSDPFGSTDCSQLSKVNDSFLNKFISFLPQVPESMRLPVILSNITGGNNFLSFLVLEIWNQASPILLIYLGIKVYKLLPFV